MRCRVEDRGDPLGEVAPAPEPGARASLGERRTRPALQVLSESKLGPYCSQQPLPDDTEGFVIGDVHGRAEQLGDLAGAMQEAEEKMNDYRSIRGDAAGYRPGLSEISALERH